MIDLLSVTAAAGKLGVTRARVLFFIREGRLKAQLVGTQYLIRPSDLKNLKIGKPGRPKKPASGK